MGPLLKKMLIGAAVFAVCGVVLGLIAPGIATVLQTAGLIESATAATTGITVAWEAAFFGMFGALVPPIQAAFNAVFGDDDHKQTQQLQEKIRTLEGREQLLEQAIAPTRSQHVGAILSSGPRTASSFRDAELARETPTEGVTIH